MDSMLIGIILLKFSFLGEKRVWFLFLFYVWRLFETFQMDERRATVNRRWDDMEIDILVRIFESLGMHELISGVAHVCRGWRLACCDPLLWKTLDLSIVESNFIKIPTEPFVYVDARSDRVLNRVLKIALNLSRGSIQTLIFHVNLFVKDELLLYTAER